METNSIHQVISFSGSLVRWLITWSWQILLLLAIAWIALKLDRSRSATTRYRIWLVALITVSALPLLNTLIYSLHLPSAISPSLFLTRNTGDFVTIASAERPDQLRISWLSAGTLLLLALWAGGVMVSFARLSSSLWKLHKIKSRAQRVSIAEINCSYPDLLPRSVAITLSKDIKAPGLAGLIRPVILLPANIVTWTNPEERISILRHEFAHLERYDHLASLFQSVLKAVLFFHPMLHYACSQLSLEREIACDDRVLELGTEPGVYAESILKVAERSCLTDVIHQTASFASKRELERRIEMILNTNRIRQPLRQVQFLLLPVLLISIMTWLVMPASSKESSFENAPLPPEINGNLSNTQSIDKAAIWVDTVKRGNMPFLVRGLGVLRATSDGRMKAQINIPAIQAKDIEIGQPASIDTRKGVVSGKVININPQVLSGIVVVEISIEGELPQGISSGLSVDGIIEVDRLEDVLFVGRPAQVDESGDFSLFKIEADGKTATRILVRLGRISLTTIEVIDGMKAGDKVIISDMSQFDGREKVSLN